MADFCYHCLRAGFGMDTKDLANLLPRSSYTEETGALALCECCGPIVVDIDGKRMSKDWHSGCRCAEELKG